MTFVVVASKRLEKLRIPGGITFSTSYGRLPAIKKLVIRDVWPYAPEAIVKSFNFSRLETLVLEGEVDIPPFVDSVRDIAFRSLRRLHVTEDDLFGKDDQESSSAKVSDFITRLDKLQKVSAVTYDPEKIINTLAKHKNSLTKLSLSIPVEVEVSFIGLKQAKDILIFFSYLVELNLSLNVPPPESEEAAYYVERSKKFVEGSVEILASLKYLETLSLRYVAHKAESLYYNEFASDIMKYLRARTKGTPLKHLCIGLEKSF